jgi:hypothetical protein
MKYKCLYSQFLGKISLLFAVALAFAMPSFAQQYSEILVAGPWSYLTDPNNPGWLFLVAPGGYADHPVYFLVNTTSGSGASKVSPGTYTLTPVGETTTYTPPTGLTAPIVCGATIASTGVTSILTNTGNPNYVIRLPMPYGYAAFPGSMGTSLSEVSSNPILNAASAPPSLAYTTYMALYYPTVASFTLQNVTAGAGQTLNIVLSDDGLRDPECDAPSLAGVKERDALWGLTQYARFPVQILSGGQWVQSSTYDYDDCINFGPALSRIQPGGMKRTTPSSADCHACELVVNGALPATVIGNK